MINNANTNCEEIQKQLSSLLDKELDADQIAQVNSHLHGCPLCQRKWESFKALSAQIRGRKKNIPPAPSWENLKQKIMNRKRKLWVKRILIPLTTAAALLIIVNSLNVRKQDQTPVVIKNTVTTTQEFDLAPYLKEVESSPFQCSNFLAQNRAQLVSVNQLTQLVSFKPYTPQTLPGGFNLEECWLINTENKSCVQLRYMKGETVVDLFQLPPGHLFKWGSKNLKEDIIAGMYCGFEQVGKLEIIQIDPENKNLAFVMRKGQSDSGALVTFLKTLP